MRWGVLSTILEGELLLRCRGCSLVRDLLPCLKAAPKRAFKAVTIPKRRASLKRELSAEAGRAGFPPPAIERDRFR